MVYCPYPLYQSYLNIILCAVKASFAPSKTRLRSLSGTLATTAHRALIWILPDRSTGLVDPGATIDLERGLFGE